MMAAGTGQLRPPWVRDHEDHEEVLMFPLTRLLLVTGTGVEL